MRARPAQSPPRCCRCALRLPVRPPAPYGRRPPCCESGRVLRGWRHRCQLRARGCTPPMLRAAAYCR
eukprot:750532-Alexandrium_andersonii.AAC.1